MIGPDTPFNLKKIDSSLLVGEENNDYDDFFLVLAVIYNDLKDLIHLHSDYLKIHERPTETQIPSGYLGEYNGVMFHFQKSMAGFLNEFFKFVKEYEDLYKQPQFLALVRKLDPSTQVDWNSIREAALEPIDKQNPHSLGYRLYRIRNELAHHYFSSIKSLRSSFRRFFADESNPFGKFAYYSLGMTMEETRFFYADATTQTYLMEVANQNPNINIQETITQFQEFQAETEKIVDEMNMVLFHLIRKYIERKHNS